MLHQKQKSILNYFITMFFLKCSTFKFGASNPANDFTLFSLKYKWVNSGRLLSPCKTVTLFLLSYSFFSFG